MYSKTPHKNTNIVRVNITCMFYIPNLFGKSFIYFAKEFAYLEVSLNVLANKTLIYL